jgi:hypothetical protein
MTPDEFYSETRRERRKQFIAGLRKSCPSIFPSIKAEPARLEETDIADLSAHYRAAKWDISPAALKAIGVEPARAEQAR